MSVLLVSPPLETGRSIVSRLVAQGDEVRVVVERDGGTWRNLGAHVAVGDPNDEDLIMRAGQSARTIVLFGCDTERLQAAVAGAAAAGIDRAVFVLRPSDRLPPTVMTRLAGYVALKSGRWRWRGPRITPDDLARAVDAADDLSGDVALELELSDPGSWGKLGLKHP